VARRIRIEGDLAYVPLTKGYEAIIDVADIPLVEAHNWYAHVQSHAVYAECSLQRNKNRHALIMHRVIMGDPAGFDIDHRDGDGLNNRRSNLRIATRAQNLHNQRIVRRNTSGFKGVSWNKRDHKWQARIYVNNKQFSLGYHATPELAHAAYCEASARLHGEFGRTQ
jgi:hypothetical protein